MVTNFYMKCDVCGSIINLKWQVGHIEYAPVSIVCPECRTILKFVLITNQKEITIDMKSKNVMQVEEVKADFVAETSSELLTYKITRQRKVQPGNTPFMRTISMLGTTGYKSYSESFLRGIGASEKYLHIYHRINDLYYNYNFEYLEKQLSEHIEINKKNKLFSKLEAIEHLYMFNITYYSSFFKRNELSDWNRQNLDMMKILRNDTKDIYADFLVDFCTDDKLNEYDIRIYKSINSILDNFYLFLPATLMGYIDESKHPEVLEDYTLTTTDFEDIKNIYMTIYENLLKVYDIIILLNNILERNDYLSFPDDLKIRGKNITTTKQFEKLTKGNKLKFLERGKYYDKLMPNFDGKIRNAIGHESWAYEPYEHKVIFKNEAGNVVHEMYLLEFVYECWKLCGKSIVVYKVIQDIKRHRELTINNIS